MSFVRSVAFKLLPLAFLGLAACRSDIVDSSADNGSTKPPVQTVPTAGYLTVHLSTPHGDDGAVQLSVQGPEIDSVQLVTYTGFATVDNAVANVVVTGSVASGDVARIYVSDVSRASQYTASVAAAAARQSYALQALDGYSVTVTR